MFPAKPFEETSAMRLAVGGISVLACVVSQFVCVCVCVCVRACVRA